MTHIFLILFLLLFGCSSFAELPQVSSYGEYPVGEGWVYEHETVYPRVEWTFLPDCVVIDEYKAARVMRIGRIDYAGTTRILSYQDALPVLLSYWPDPVDLNVFASYAKHYKPDAVDIPLIKEPEPVIDPNVCTSVASKYYHTCGGCRYYRDTMFEINVIDALLMGKIPCPYCKPVFWSPE